MASNIASITSTVQMDDGIHLHVKVLGDDAKTTKPLLIGLHGAPGLSTLLEPESSFSFLSDIFRVLVFDARGSGASSLTGPFTHDRWIKDIENLRQWAGAETFVLAGGSYGGFISLDYAILHSDRLSGLILRDTWANGVLGMMTALASCLMSDRLKVNVARQGNLTHYAPPEDPNMVAKERAFEGLDTKDKRSAYHAATQNAAFSLNMPRFDVRGRLGEIKIPTLVVVGRHDHITPVEFSEVIANGIPHARLEIFEHSGHSPPTDEPEKFQATFWTF